MQLTLTIRNHRHNGQSTIDNLVQLWSYVYMTPTKRPGIRQAYTDLGLTRQMFADRVQLSPQAVTNIVHGAGMSDATATRIAAVLGWTRKEVVAGERKLDRESDDDPSEHVTPQPLPPARPPQEPRRPPTKPPQRGAA